MHYGYLMTAGVAFLALLVGCSQDQSSSPEISSSANHSTASEAIRASVERIDGDAIIANDAHSREWLTYNHGYSEQRYSRLTEINTENVTQLGLAWSFDLGSTRGVEATPVVVGRVMYVTGPWSVVHALDAETGESLWQYDPEVPPEYAARACCDVVNRGVAVAKGKVFVGTLDGYLVALDPATGEELWRRDTFGQYREKYIQTITGAPRVIDDLVLIGNGGAEMRARGYLTAYHIDSGEQAWRWYSVPEGPKPPFHDASMEIAAKTWDPEGAWRQTGGGGTMWDSMAYDPKQGLLFVGVGNGSPWNHEVRSPSGGDNLFLSSIVALKAETGEYVWHFQEVPGDTWDFTATQQIILAELEIDGKAREVVLHAPKNGFFYVIDRTNGRLISAEPFVEVNWAEGYDASGRPIENPNARGREAPWETKPSAYGAHNWHPMSYNLMTGLVYIPAQGVPLAIQSDPEYQVNTHQPGHPMSNLGWNLGHLVNTIEPQAKPFGHLVAWDPVAQKEVWRQEYLSPWYGGTTTTAGGLVFQGTADGRFIAYNAETGDPLWQVPVTSGVIAGPSTFELNGTQYVSIAVGWGGVYGMAERHTEQLRTGRVYTFKLNGSATLPEVHSSDNPRSTTLVSGYKYATQDVGPGALLYVSSCLFCHGLPGINNGGALPNPGYVDLEMLESLPELLLGGAWSSKGMPSFEGKLTPAEAKKIAAFIQSTAESAKLAAQATPDES